MTDDEEPYVGPYDDDVRQDEDQAFIDAADQASEAFTRPVPISRKQSGRKIRTYAKYRDSVEGLIDNMIDSDDVCWPEVLYIDIDDESPEARMREAQVNYLDNLQYLLFQQGITPRDAAARIYDIAKQLKIIP